jgi:hypothetical protein
MTPSVRNFSRASLLSYIEDCHGLTPYDLEEREIDTKSRSDVADAIECYGWAADCFGYCS